MNRTLLDDLDGALCVDTPDLFDVDPGSDLSVESAAARVCRRCPVLVECAVALVSADEPPSWGVQAGVIWRKQPVGRGWVRTLARAVAAIASET